MPEEKLRSLFRKQREQCGPRTDSCPGDEEIANLIGRELPAEEATPLKTHVADCAFCTSLLANAVRTTNYGTVECGATDDGTAPGLRAIAAAAMLAVVAITAFWQLPDDGITPEEAAELRAVREPQSVPSLVFPTERQNVSAADMTVRWTPVADAIHYSVRIVDDYGRIVVDSFADAPAYAVPPHIRLAPGTNYYVKIDAYVVGDKAVSSSHVHFTVAD